MTTKEYKKKKFILEVQLHYIDLMKEKKILVSDPSNITLEEERLKKEIIELEKQLDL